MTLPTTSQPPPTYNIPTIWRNKTVLIMDKQAPLPERCIKCNAPTQHTLKRNLRWHHPALYLMIFVGFLFYVVLALVMSKTASIYIGLCETHAKARRRDILITWVLVLLAFVSFYLAAATEEMTSFFVALVILFCAAIYGLVKVRIVTPRKIDDHYVWLTGISTDYLEQFPEWRSGR